MTGGSLKPEIIFDVRLDITLRYHFETAFTWIIVNIMKYLFAHIIMPNESFWSWPHWVVLLLFCPRPGQTQLTFTKNTDFATRKMIGGVSFQLLERMLLPVNFRFCLIKLPYKLIFYFFSRMLIIQGCLLFLFWYPIMTALATGHSSLTAYVRRCAILTGVTAVSDCTTLGFMIIFID